MLGTIKKIHKRGFGVIAGSDGSMFPFIAAELGNQVAEVGQTVAYAVHTVNDTAFARHITIMRRSKKDQKAE